MKNRIDESLEKIFNIYIENTDEFYEEIYYSLPIEEREKIKNNFFNKNCYNCLNGICKVPYKEKDNHTSCIGWQNQKLLGKSYILKKK